MTPPPESAPANPRLPPQRVLRAVLSALEAAGIPAVVGGSAVLAAHGAPLDAVNDWDVLVEADVDVVAAALARIGAPIERAPEPAPHPYASDALLRVDGGDHTIDVIVRFRLRGEDGLITVPVRAGSHWRGLPVARADDWAAAYRAMGRPDRARALDAAQPSAGGIASTSFARATSPEGTTTS